MYRQLAALAFALTVLVGLAHALGYSTVLPDRVATQFDAGGVPAAWSTRSSMIDMQLTVIIAVTGLFLVAAGAALRSPVRWLVVPHRDRWLAPAHLERTRQDLAVRLLWLGAATQLLICDLFHRTVRVNLGRTDTLENCWLDVGIFAGLILLWLAILLWRYRRPPATAS